MSETDLKLYARIINQRVCGAYRKPSEFRISCIACVQFTSQTKNIIYLLVSGDPIIMEKNIVFITKFKRIIIIIWC